MSYVSAVTQWSESHRTHNHTVLSHLRLPQPGGPGSRISHNVASTSAYIAQVKSSYIMTYYQTASLSWCQAPLLEPQPSFPSFFIYF
jgi:hypothetical protein